MAYILLDESGDLGFSDKKGSSKFFIVTIIFIQSKRILEKIAKRVHETLGKKKVVSLHANNQSPIIRQRMLKRLNNSTCQVLVIVLDKSRVYTKMQNEKPALYNYVANILLDRLFTRKPVPMDHPVTLIASQRETNRFLNENFKDYVSRQMKDNHQIELKIEIATPSQEKALQVVDFASWAIFRKYEMGDDSYCNLIKEKIIEEKPLFP